MILFDSMSKVWMVSTQFDLDMLLNSNLNFVQKSSNSLLGLRTWHWITLIFKILRTWHWIKPNFDFQFKSHHSTFYPARNYKLFHKSSHLGAQHPQFLTLQQGSKVDLQQITWSKLNAVLHTAHCIAIPVKRGKISRVHFSGQKYGRKSALIIEIHRNSKEIIFNQKLKSFISCLNLNPAIDFFHPF